MANSTSEAPAFLHGRCRSAQMKGLAGADRSGGDPSFDYVVVDLDSGWSHNDDEKCGQHTKDHREEHLDGGLLRLLLDQLTLSNTSLFCLGTQDQHEIKYKECLLPAPAPLQERAQFVDVRTAVDSFQGLPLVRASWAPSPRNRENSSRSGPGTELTDLAMAS